ncbi:hypothetical protein [Colwellia sp. TT2012]|uniref:hypothetical protein n=1 Tax=Colwellia sp. TT2012 TaxID=1720342 RepID=UPI00070C94F5|nr:hypothetical protein [Colwellia sp. TT2012]
MTNNNSPKEQQQLAQQLFCANDAYTSLTKMSRVTRGTANFTIVFNDIIQLVKNNSQADFIKRTPLIIKKINTDLRLRKIYLQLIKQLRFAESGLQAAASSANILPGRITENFSLKFKRDHIHLSQIYVILTINHPAEHHFNHAIALHITIGEQVNCLYFPILTDGSSQLLMEDSDSLFKLITNSNSHLYLM